MNGLVFYRGYRYDISAVDLAMLTDMGVPINDLPGILISMAMSTDVTLHLAAERFSQPGRD